MTKSPETCCVWTKRPVDTKSNIIRKSLRLILIFCPTFSFSFSSFYLGELNLTLGTRETINMALLFLYGKCPKLTNENIFDMFDLAEFLMIPNLKSFCCKWIHRVNINDDNVETLLHISSLFDFELTTLTRYTRRHLDVLFAGDRLLSLTPDSLEFLLTDQTLSYVSSDERLLFVLKWAQHSFEERSAFLEEIFLVRLLDVTEITRSALAKAKQMESYREIESFISDHTVHVAENRKVLVTTDRGHANRLLVYDIERKQWFAVRLDNVMLNDAKIQAYSYDSSVMFIQPNTHETKIRVVDLAEKTIETTDIVCNNDSGGFKIRKLLFGGSECYATCDREVRTIRNDTERRYRFEKSRVHKTEIFVGHILPTGNDDKTPLTPLLAFKENGKMNIVANEAKLSAALGKDRKCIYIYDLIDCQMTKVALRTDNGDILAVFHDGFVVYNDSRIVRIVQVRNNQDTLVKKEFKVFETKLSDGNASIVKYIPLGTMWIRYPRHMVMTIRFASLMMRSEESHIEFTHADLGIVNPDEADWTSVEWPKENESKSRIEAIQEMAVPKNALKCNIECPHCDGLEDKRSPQKHTPIHDLYWRTYRDNDNDRFYYDDNYDSYDSDNHYNYDSDNYYSYDSDN